MTATDEFGEVNVDRVFELLDGPSAIVDDLVASPNPDYQVTKRIDTMPIRIGVEVLGPSAAKVHLRDQNTLITALMSSTNLRRLRDQIDEALTTMEADR